MILKSMKRFSVRGLSLSSVAFAGAVALSTPAFAQAQTAPAEDADAGGIADIIVTAQRREESLQTVPLSIVAISGEQLRNADIRDITRLEQSVPGLRIARSGAAARPAIRGVYTENISAASDPRIGFYIDEIYQSRLQQTTGAFVDLERVEVQKGPQGTLFGRNSLGGNIAVSSAKPTDQFDGGVGLIYGNYKRIKAEAFVNLPITDGLALRVAGAVDRHDPYYKSVVNDRASIGDLNYQYVRATLRFAPPSLDDRFEVILRGSYYNQDDRGLSSFNAKQLGAIIDPSLIRAPGGSVTYNNATYPFPFGYNGGNYATGVLVPFTPVFRDGVADIGGADIGLAIPGKYGILHNFPAENRVKSKNGSLTINFGLSDDIRLRSITGYTDFATTNRSDGDGGPVPVSEFYFITKAKTFTQELQLQSANAESPLQYTVGGFYMLDKVGEGQGTVRSGNNYTTLTAAANGLPVLYASGSGCGFTYSPLSAPSSCNINNTTTADDASPVAARTQSYAGYAQLSYKVTEKLTLTLGGRYTVDEKIYKNVGQVSPFVAFVGGTTGYVFLQNQAFLNANPAATQAQLPFAGDASAASLIRGVGGANAGFTSGTGYRATLPFNENRNEFNQTCGGFTPGTFAATGTNTIVGAVPNYFLTRCGARTFKYFTYRIAADYQITPDNLIYASFSTGVKSGGFGSPFVSTTVPQGEFSTFNEERVQAIEFGSKNSFFDRRLQVNLAVFYNKYKDNQVQGTQLVTTGPNTSIGLAVVTNSGDTNAPGAEISFIAKPTSRLTLRGSLNYLRARNTVAPLGIFGSGLCTISTGGGPCTIVDPTMTGTGRASSAGLGSGFFPNPFTNPELFVPIKNSAGLITGYDSLFFGVQTRVQNTPDWSSSFGASYDMDIGNGSTLTPEFDVIYSGSYLLSASAPNVIQKAYAKIDARITLRTDDGLSLQAFVQNLTKKATLGRITTGTLAAQGTYSDPRTYGVRVGYKF